MKAFSKMANLFSTAVIVGQILVSGVGGVVQAAETTTAETAAPVTTQVAPAQSTVKTDGTASLTPAESSATSATSSTQAADSSTVSKNDKSQVSLASQATSEKTSSAPVKEAPDTDKSAKDNSSKDKDITDQFDLPKGTTVIEHANGALTVTLPAGKDFTSGMKAQFAKYDKVDVVTNDDTRAAKDISTLPGADQLPKDGNGHVTLFTTADLTKDGKVLDANNPVKLGDKLKLAYKFDIPEALRANMQAGDFFKFDIPKELNTDSAVSISMAQNGTEFATLTIPAGGTVGTITFTDNVTKLTQISGFANVTFTLNSKTITKPGTPSITIPYVTGPKTVTPTVIVDQAALVEKQFVENTAKFPANPTLTWKITVNKNLATLKNGKITEALPQSTSKYTVTKIVEADVDLSGKVTEKGADIKSQFGLGAISGASGNTPSATITLPQNTDKAYVVYVTTEIDQMAIIENNRSSNFVNQATVAADGITPLSSKASTTLSQKYQPMVTKTNADFKTGAKAGDGTVDWTIKFNPDALPLPAASAGLEDVYGTNDNVKQSIKDGTFKIVPVGSTTPLKQGTDYTIDASGTGIKIKFLKDVTQALNITYTTNVTGVKPGVTVNNGLTWKNATSNSHATVTGSGIVKKSGNVNYANKTVDWTIGVNAAKAPLQKWTVTDTLGNSKYTDLSKLTVRDDTTKTILVRGVDYTLTDNGGSFTINYNKATSDAFTIAYQAQWLFGQTQQNKAIYDYFTVDGESVINADTQFKPMDMPKIEIDKSGQYSSPKDKEITWNVDWNTENWHKLPNGANQIPLGNDVKITDPIHDDQEYIESSAKVVAVEADGSKHEIPVKYDAATKILTVDDASMAGSTAVYTLTYKTKVIPAKALLAGTDVVNALPGNEISNTAYYHDDRQDTNVVASLPATTTQNFVDKTGVVDTTKTGVTNAPFINWTLNVNPEKLLLQNVTIRDDNWQNITLVPGTIKVVDGAGNTVPANQYTLEVAQKYFELHFVNDITQNYKVTYQTNSSLLTQDPGQGWPATNDVKITGDNIKAGLPPLKDVIQVATPDNFGGAKGVLYNLDVTKKGARTKLALADAEFSLYTKAGDLVDKQIAGQDGVAHFTGLKKGDYYVRETKAPKGYSIGDDLPVTIGAAGDNVETVKQMTYTDREFGDLIVKKTDSVNPVVLLPGAQYALMDKSGTTPIYVPQLDDDGYSMYDKNNKPLYVQENGKDKPMVATTDENGELKFAHIASGDYQLKELNAPTDYQIGANVPVTFSTATDLTTKKTVTDVLKTGQVSLTKTDFKTGIPVAGADFTLQDQTGKVIYGADKKTPITGTTGSNGVLTITGIAPGDYQLVETKQPANYLLDATPNKFTITRSQMVPDAPQLAVTNKQIPGNVLFTKTDAQTGKVIQGAIFKLVGADNNAVVDNDKQPLPTTYKTDANGQINVKNLTPGDYKFVEVTAATGYVDDVTGTQFTQKFTIVPSQTATLQLDPMVNQERPGSVVLTKWDAQTSNGENGKRLANAEFKVEHVLADGTTEPAKDAQGNVLATNLATKTTGQLEVKNLLPGKYQFIETKAPTGYELNKQALPFTIDFNQQTVVTKDFFDDETPGAVTLTKTDAQHAGQAVANAEFKVVKVVGNTTEPAKDAQGKLLATDLKTGADGKLTVANLMPGKYQFIETKAPAGYVLDATAQPFEIVINQQTVPNVAMTNAEKPGAVELTKIDAQHNEVTIAGAEFKLVKVVGDTTEPAKDAQGNLLATNLKTAANGKLTVTNLLPGKYQFVETKAPTGYVLNNAPLDFEITFNQVTTKTVDFENQEKPGSVILTKSDAQHPKIKIADTEFKITDASGTVVTDTTGKLLQKLLTKQGGLLQVDNLLPGTYYFVETHAAAGYELDSTPLKFNIVFNQDKDHVELSSMSNEEVPGKAILTKTDAQNGKPVAGAVYSLINRENQKVIRENLITYDDGTIDVDNLLPGDYEFVETKAPAGYVLDMMHYEFTIEFNPSLINPSRVSVKEEEKRGGVVLTKLDAQTKKSGRTLQKAEFTVYDKNGQVVEVAGKKLINQPTDADGQLAVDGLLPGDYYMKETKAPIGFEISDEKVPFTVAFDQKEVAKPEISDNETPGSVILTKKDQQTGESGNRLAGAQFKIVHVLADGEVTEPAKDAQDNELATDLPTDENGQLQVDNLLPGEYQFIETKAPTGYELNETPVDFTIVLNQQTPIAVEISDAETPGAVTLTKKDAQTHESGALLADAEFKIIDAAGQPAKDAQGNDLATDLSTDENGQLTVTNLLPGNYQFVETKAPIGYDLNITPVDFAIAFNQQSSAEVDYLDQETAGTVILTKTDAQNSKVIAGTEFKVVDGDGAVVTDTKGASLENLATDTTGKITIGNLLPGKYSLVETKATAGYVLDAAPIDFEIAFNQAEPALVKPTNEETPGSVELTKTDAQNGKTVADAEFKIIDAAGKLANDSQGVELPTNLTTDKHGKLVVKNLLPGEYRFVETKAPKGYDLDKTPVAFTIDFDQQALAKATMENNETAGSVVLTKLDAATQQRLAHAHFDLKTASGEVVKTNLKTNAEGQLTVKHLRPGKYRFVETKAPKGYKLSKKSLKFKIVFNQETALAVTKFNHKLEVTPKTTRRHRTKTPRDHTPNEKTPSDKSKTPTKQTPNDKQVKTHRVANANKRASYTYAGLSTQQARQRAARLARAKAESLANRGAKLVQTGFRESINWFGLAVGFVVLSLGIWVFKRKQQD